MREIKKEKKNNDLDRKYFEKGRVNANRLNETMWWINVVQVFEFAFSNQIKCEQFKMNQQKWKK